MNKSQTLLKSGTDPKFDKLNEGDLVFAFQANRLNETEDGYQLETNMDWSFDDPTTPQEVKCFLGSILSAIEGVFGEKMVTEAIVHYALEQNRVVITPQGAKAQFNSKGLSFKEWENKKE